VVYDVYSIKSKITKDGSKVEAGYYIDKRNRLTRKVRWQQVDNPITYFATQLDRDVVAPDQIRTVIKTFKERLFTELFPGRKEVPKTLIFAKDDSHAEDIVNIVREQFGKGNDFCKKITYKTTGEKPEDILASFRNSYNPRIAVSVDMLSTGTDIRPLECLIFMRDVRSRNYFEQMIGRGTRTISSTDLNAVTSDAIYKTHFICVDAVGVFESIKTDPRPTGGNPSIPLEKLLLSVAMGNRGDDVLLSLGGRLSRVERQMDESDKKEIKQATNGLTLKQIIGNFIDAANPDTHIDKAKEVYGVKEPTSDHIQKVKEDFIKFACLPIENPEFRDRVVSINRKAEQIIDNVSKDEIIFAGGSEVSKERAEAMVRSFRKFIEDNKDEITALQIIYNKPYNQKKITYSDIKSLADAIRKPPYSLTPELVWDAYLKLEKSKVKGAGPEKLLTNIISLIRFTAGQENILEPFPDVVEKKFQSWIIRQNDLGKGFTMEQEQWLNMIKDHIANSVSIEVDDLDDGNFFDKGGRVKAYNLFGNELTNILNQLNQELV
jgi:type I restriction enzyme, R subunit